MEQPAIDAREQKILKARYENIMLVKCILYVFVLAFFAFVGLMLGNATVFYNQEIFLSEQLLGEKSAGFAALWTRKSNLMYAAIILPITIGTLYLTYKFQRRLSAISPKKSGELAAVDGIISCLNIVAFYCAFSCGIAATTISISFQLGPD